MYFRNLLPIGTAWFDLRSIRAAREVVKKEPGTFIILWDLAESFISDGHRHGFPYTDLCKYAKLLKKSRVVELIGFSDSPEFLKAARKCKRYFTLIESTPLVRTANLLKEYLG